MKRAVVNVATTAHFVKGQNRLRAALMDFSPGAATCLWTGSKMLAPGATAWAWRECLPKDCPPHSVVPYAMKAYAMREAAEKGFELLLWCDASILPIRDMEPLWQRIERDGYLVWRGGYKNSQWTNMATLPLLGVTAEENEKIEHVVATCFGVSVAHPVGKRILDEYFRLANNGSFCGPWDGGIGVQHRHDQSGLSVICHKLGCKLTDPQDGFSYGKAGDKFDSKVIVIADGSYQ